MTKMPPLVKLQPRPSVGHLLLALRAIVARELLKFSRQYGRLVSALVRHVREGDLERDDAGHIQRALVGELERGEIGWVELNSSVHRSA